MELKELVERKNVLEKDISHALKVLVDEFIDDINITLILPSIEVELRPEPDYRPIATCKYTKYVDVSVRVNLSV